jgi:hypothetical protein
MYEEQKEDRNDWHNAVFGAIQLEFVDYKDALEFTSEYPITTEPMRIDILIVKKIKNIVIKKNIGQIFRNYNIVEYKNPNDNFTVTDFGKTLAYCYAYTSKNEVPITDISLSIIVSMEPRTVFQHLKDVYGWNINEKYPGIYIVSGAGMAFPIQLINSKKLPESENLWLKNLREGVSVESLEKVFDESKKLKGTDKVTFAAYLYVLGNANKETMKELIKMEKSAFDELMEETGMAAMWEQRGMEKANQQWEAKTQQWQSKEAEYQRLLDEERRRNAQLQANAGSRQ